MKKIFAAALFVCLAFFMPQLSCADDADNDTIADNLDNCPAVANLDQTDNDSDGYGDVCDSNSAFAVLDTYLESVVIFDIDDNETGDNTTLDNATIRTMTVDINTLGNYWTMRNAGDSGWLLKGQTDNGTFKIWHMDTSGALRGQIPATQGGIFYAGLRNGTVVQNDFFTGAVTQTSSEGALLKTINVWNDNNLATDKDTRMGDVAGLTGGGFVVVPVSGRLATNGAGHTPLLCYYNDNMTLQAIVDISPLACTLISLSGMPGGGFVALGNTDGSDHITHLFYFDDAGELIQDRDITVDIPNTANMDYRSFLISAGSDGGVTVSLYNQSRIWVYHSPPVMYDLSGNGISRIGGLGGSYMGSLSPATDCEFHLYEPKGQLHPVRPAFSWKKIEGVSRYQVVVQAPRIPLRKAATAWLDAAAVCDGDNCTATLSKDLRPGSYRWFLRTRGGQCAKKSVNVAFTVEPCENPVLASPSNKTFAPGEKPVFEFSDTGATGYNLFATTATMFGRMLSTYRWYKAEEICDNGTCTVTLEKTFSKGKTWWWVNSWSSQCRYMVQPADEEKSFFMAQ